MLVDDHPERAHSVCEHLRATGYTILAQINSAEGLLFQIEKHRPDIVLIDIESPDRKTLESLAIMNRKVPTAAAMFSSRGDQSGVRPIWLRGLRQSAWHRL